MARVRKPSEPCRGSLCLEQRWSHDYVGQSLSASPTPIVPVVFVLLSLNGAPAAANSLSSRYRKVAMEPDEVIVAVFLPNATRRSSGISSASPPPAATAVGDSGGDVESFSPSFEFVRPFKQVIWEGGRGVKLVPPYGIAHLRATMLSETRRLYSGELT